VKLDPKYQEKRGIETGPAKNLAPEVQAKLVRYAKRICRTLQLDGYCRIDFRLTDEGIPYFLEANPIPDIAETEEFAEAAKHDGIGYTALINRILALGIARARSGTSRG
jgi:D-alanine-D-alanine ligase